MPIAGTVALACAVLGSGPAPEVSEGVPPAFVPESVNTPRISAAILLTDDLDPMELERAVRLRLPNLVLVGPDEDPPPATAGTLRALIEFHRVAPARVKLTFVLEDGRAYLREVIVDPDAPARPLATTLANLIAAIEDQSAVPDRKDSPVPLSLTPPSLVTEPPLVRTRERISKQASLVRPTPSGRVPASPRWELGPTLRVGLTVDPETPELRGFGGGLGLDARARAGMLLTLDVHGLLRQSGDYLLTRPRLALGIGYALRRGGFESLVAALVGLEAWRLRDRGETVTLAPPKHDPRLLLGLGVRVGAGYSAPVGERMRLRVGLRVDLWGSSEPRAGALRRPVVRLPEGQHLGLGGPELQFALEVGLWFGVGAVGKVGKVSL